MAQAISKAARFRPEIRLSQALSEFEAILSVEQKASFRESPPNFNSVMTLTCEIDRQNAHRKTRRCAARLTSFLNSVVGFTSVIDSIVSSSGNPIAGAVWGAVKTAIQTTLGFESYYDSLSQLLMNLGLSSPRIERYAFLYPSSPSLRKELCDYYSVVISLCTKVILFVRKPVVRQIATALRKPFADEFGAIQKDLIRLASAVKDEVSLVAKEQQNTDSIEASRERKDNALFRKTGLTFRKETLHELAQARHWRKQKLKSLMLRSCSTYNHEVALNRARKKGVSTWIFQCDEYRQWKSQGTASNLLCSGMVGAGKTVLSASVIEDLSMHKPPSTSLGHFFCSSDDATSRKAREVMGSLARQLFENLPVEKFQSIGEETSLGDVSFDIYRIQSYMLKLLPHHQRYMMVLDGLDECEQDEIKILVDCLPTLMRAPEHFFHLFWTGRSDLVSNLSGQLRPDLQVTMSALANGPEIARYIQLALEDALENQKLKLRRDPKLVLEIKEALEVGAEGMFLWVAFQIEAICAENTNHDIRSALQTLPKGLPATFRRILRRLHISSSSGLSDSRKISLGKKIFEIVAAAQRPLTLEELAEAISITPGDTTWDQSKLVNDVLKSLESCGSFIVVDEELLTVYFAHASVKRHLLSEPTHLDVEEYHIQEEEAGISLGIIIVTYLSLDVLSNQLTKVDDLSTSNNAVSSSLQLNTSVPSTVLKTALPEHDIVNKALAILRGRATPARYDLGSRPSADVAHTQTQIYPFLSYCQDHWLQHTKNFWRLQVSTSDSRNHELYKLWDSLLHGSTKTVSLPWIDRDRSAALWDTDFIRWIEDNRHTAFMVAAIPWVCDNWNSSTGRDSDNGLTTMEEFLRLVPDSVIDNVIDVQLMRDKDVLVNAATYGQPVTVQCLLRVGVDVNIRSQNGRYPTALSAAIRNGYVTIAEFLVNNGADVNAKGREDSPPLYAAVGGRGMENIVKLLLENGEDVNGTGGENGTALSVATKIALSDRYKVPEKADNRTARPLDRLSTMKLLLKAGADVHAYKSNNVDRCSPLGLAAMALPNTTMEDLDGMAVRVLIEAGANINEICNAGGERPLQVAAGYKNEHFVRWMLNQNAIIYEKLESWRAYKKRYQTTDTIARLLFKATNFPQRAT